MIEKVESRFFINWAYVILLIAVIFTNVFYEDLANVLCLYPKVNERNYTQVHFINVGQGDAIALTFANGQTMLVDSGTELYSDELLTYLDKMVIKNNTIDFVVLTHPDSDHSSNMLKIINKYKIGKFYRPNVYEISEGKEPYCENYNYKTILDALNNKNIPTYMANSFVYFEAGNAKINFLCPTDGMIADYEGTNSISPVIIVEENNSKLMLTGDIDSKIEERLIDLYGDELDIDILKLAHHGSNNSNSEEFLEHTSPRTAVVSVGENRYGHPSNDTIERILKYDVSNNANLYDNFYSTINDGNIIITLNENLLMQSIDNISKYIFVPYYLFTIIISLVILFFLAKPYMVYLIKYIKFEFENRRYKRLKQKGLLIEKSKKLEKT